MKYSLLKSNRWILIFLMSLLTSTLMAEETKSSMLVTDLRCEYVQNPLGVDVAIPNLSWKLTDSARGQRQTAYEICVASDSTLLKNGNADLWNSGKITSTQSTLIPLHSVKFHSGQLCYWKVRTYDKDNEVTSWSHIARFSIGLLETSDWKGQWIKHPTAAAEQHCWFRKNFQLDNVLKSALIYVASIGYHELYINGKKVDDRILAPSLTRLDKRALYVTYDITSFLKKGNNTIAIWYGPGWSVYEFFRMPQVFKVQMNGVTSNGEQFSLQSDASWKCAVSNSANNGKCEYRDHGAELLDATRYVSDWNAVNFDDSQWQQVKDTVINIALSSQIMPPTRILETIHSQSITALPNNKYKADMGKNYTGWIDLKLKGMRRGDTVLIKIADDDKTEQDFAQRMVYICNGEKEEQFRNRFNYAAGRYITIEGLKDRSQLESITGYVIGTDLEQTGHFTCSKELFNKIYDTDLWTYRCNTIEGYTSDCPHRERLGYGEEVFATSWGIGFPNYDVNSFYKKHVRDWTDVQEDDGWINHTAPQINRHYGGTMWSSAGLNVSCEFYKNTGDKRILEAIYPSAKKWLEFLNSKCKDGLLCQYGDHWGKFLGDWAAPGDRKEKGDSPEAQYFNNCTYVMNLTDFIAIARLLGNEEDAALYSKRLADLKVNIHNRFYNPQQRVYSKGTQVQMAFALLTNIVPDSCLLAVKERFEEIMKEKPYLDMGSSGLPVLLKYLIERYDGNSFMNQCLSKETLPGFGYFLAQGETTWPEYWSVDVPSKIHTCFTGIASWFMKSLAGIQPSPEQPGFRQFIIKPYIAKEVSFVRADEETEYGKIKVDWKKGNSDFTLNCSIPVNSQALVYIPADNYRNVTESGKKIKNDKNIHFLKTEGKYTVYVVLSGDYSFVSSL